jgi:predicted Zn-dependent peptidase
LGSTLFNLPNKNDSFYPISNASPLTKINGHSTHTAVLGKTEISITTLSNGITVVSETPDVPGAVGLQVLLNVGTRDENSKTSGFLLSLKNSYYKTVLNTNETINYGMVQQSGGSFTMDYDQEHTIFKASCLSHDVVDIFNMVSDCAIEPRSVVAANVAIGKAKGTHAMHSGTGAHFNDTLFRTAFGLNGLGNPILGLQSNIEYLNASVLQSFQMKNITPNRIIIGGCNVENHEEFVELVEHQSAFAAIPAQESTKKNFREET